MSDQGWRFGDYPGSDRDDLNGATYLNELYTRADPAISGRATVIDGQSVNTSENTAISRFDAGKRIKLRHVFADGGYAGPKLRDTRMSIGRWTIQVIRRFDTAKSFEALPRRWVVERTFAWLGRCRRPARDWEKTVESAEAWVLIALIRRMARLLART